MENSRIFTSYFTTRADPQRGCYHPPDEFELIRPWYESVTRLGLHATVFHDALSASFRSRYENEFVEFRTYPLVTGWSVNDERFRCWMHGLERRPDLEWIVLSDLFDVEFVRDPFTFMRERPLVDLFVGDDDGQLLGDPCADWMNRKMKQAYGEVLHIGRTKLVCGTVGGRRDHVLSLLRRMDQEFRRLDSALNIDMPVFNRSVHDAIASDRILAGPPFSSPFRAGATTGDFCIRHK